MMCYSISFPKSFCADVHLDMPFYDQCQMHLDAVSVIELQFLFSDLIPDHARNVKDLGPNMHVVIIANHWCSFHIFNSSR